MFFNLFSSLIISKGDNYMKKAIIGYASLVLIPMIPVFLLYWAFKDQNLLKLNGWSSYLFASGPIAAYVLIAYFGTKMFPDISNVVNKLSEEDLHYLTGCWSLQSTTLQSEKESTGKLKIIYHKGKLSFTGCLDGSKKIKIGQVNSTFCDYDSTQNWFKALYKVTTFNDNGVLLTSECMLSAVALENEDDSMTIKGNWFHLQGATISGTIVMNKVTKTYLI
jgi:hypothetical protein